MDFQTAANHKLTSLKGIYAKHNKKTVDMVGFTDRGLIDLYNIRKWFLCSEKDYKHIMTYLDDPAVSKDIDRVLDGN
jgi:hypothetical protein